MVFSYDQNQSLGYLTGLASRLLSNILAMRFHEADIDMTAEQWGALIILLNGGAMTQGELGERLYLEKSGSYEPGTRKTAGRNALPRPPRSWIRPSIARPLPELSWKKPNAA